MELQQINQRISVVNGESKRLNSERQVLIGRRQTLEKQLSDALTAYKKEYGVELTAENIDAEIARVSALKEAEVSGIETMLSLIKAGRYDEAERLAQGPVAVPVEDAVAGGGQYGQEQQDMQETQDMQEPAFGGMPPDVSAPPGVSSPPVVSAPPIASASPESAKKVGAVGGMPPTFARPADPPVPAASPTFASTAKTAKSAPQLPVDEDTPPAPPAPPPTFGKPKPKQPLGTPKLGVPPAVGGSAPQTGKLSFNAILSGEAFNPQGGG